MSLARMGRAEATKQEIPHEYEEQKMPKFSLLLVASMVAGCTTKPIVMPIDEGTYLAYQETTASLPRTEAAILEEASGFCESNGQNFQVLDAPGVTPSMGPPAAASLRFRCVDRD